MKQKLIINLILISFLAVALVQGLETFDNGVVIIQKATSGTNLVAANIVSYNPDASAVWITGRESKYGTLKIGHIKPEGIDDANAAALSLYNSGSGTKAQGIFLDSDGSTGKLLNLRVSKKEMFTVDSNGNIVANSITLKNQPKTTKTEEQIPTQTTGATGSFRSIDRKTITVENGVIVSIK